MRKPENKSGCFSSLIHTRMMAEGKSDCWIVFSRWIHGVRVQRLLEMFHLTWRVSTGAPANEGRCVRAADNNNLPAVLLLQPGAPFLSTTDVSARLLARWEQRRRASTCDSVSKTKVKSVFLCLVWRWDEEEVEDSGVAGASSRRERSICLDAN